MTTPDQASAAAEARFILFTACILASVAGGYILRRRGVLRAEWSRPIMSAAIVACDAPVAWLAIWFLRMEADVWKVPVAGAAVGVATCLLGLAVARWRRMAPDAAAVFGLQAGMGNVGYTLGGALAFVLWGIQGLALEQMFCMMWPFFAFLFCFPVARHYGERAAGVHKGGGLAAYAVRALGRSMADLRSLPLYTAALGLALNLAGAVPPEFVRRWHLIDAVMVVGILMQFGGVGMTVRASRLVLYWKTALGSAAIKFLASPALMLAAALGMGMTGTPLAVCLLLAAMPTAIYSVLMANLFGLNKDLANTTFILTHAICFAAAIPPLCLWHAWR
ncbi:MAG: hypothetical protein FJ288_11940 [Planctomycetes bacterium]|nr:hypothetical protein [Planctomycetota bacterium]